MEKQLFAFESWQNGNKYQTSALYVGVEALSFIESHNQSNTFASLHVYESEQEAIEAMNYYMQF